MNIESFKNILLDLYSIYNPSKIKEIDRIVGNYDGKEYDAIKTVLIKYNYKGHPGYNENANRDEYVDFLIKSYSKGERVVSEENLLRQTKEEELEKIKKSQLEKDIKEKEKESIVKLGNEVKNEIKKEIDELYNSVNDLIDNKTKEINEYFKSKNIEFDEKQNLIKNIQTDVLNYTGKTIENKTIETRVSHTKINIENLNFTDSDIKLPPQEVLETLSKGTRIIVKNSEGRVCGIEVKDVTYDLISYDGEIVKEMILERI
tara:strand:+ start:157 stop:936 length:780 start_codon:yes stop_codon:yes gene_type:complete